MPKSPTQYYKVLSFASNANHLSRITPRNHKVLNEAAVAGKLITRRIERNVT
jgi:hypothetical protein